MILITPIEKSHSFNHREAFNYIHQKIEIRLLTNTLLRLLVSDELPDNDIQALKNNIQHFLIRSLKKNKSLPYSSFEFSIPPYTCPTVINFSELRLNIRVAHKSLHLQNNQAVQSSSDHFMLQVHWEFMIGMRDQCRGVNQNESVYRIRQQEERNQQLE
jgi:hypothetical protein